MEAGKYWIHGKMVQTRWVFQKTESWRFQNDFNTQMSLLCSSTNWSPISFLSSFLSFFSQGWSAPGWSLWTQGGQWGWAGALNPAPSPPLSSCSFSSSCVQGRKWTSFILRKKNQLGKALWTSPTPTWRDGTAMASEMAGKLLLTWMASSPQRGFCTKNPKAYKVIKNCASKVCVLFFCLFFFLFCF